MKKRIYQAPAMELVRVRVEHGFMKASIFEPGDNHDKGFSIEGHQVGADDNYAAIEDGADNKWD